MTSLRRNIREFSIELNLSIYEQILVRFHSNHSFPPLYGVQNAGCVSLNWMHVVGWTHQRAGLGWVAAAETELMNSGHGCKQCLVWHVQKHWRIRDVMSASAVSIMQMMHSHALVMPRSNHMRGTLVYATHQTSLMATLWCALHENAPPEPIRKVLNSDQMSLMDRINGDWYHTWSPINRGS